MSQPYGAPLLVVVIQCSYLRPAPLSAQTASSVQRNPRSVQRNPLRLSSAPNSACQAARSLRQAQLAQQGIAGARVPLSGGVMPYAVRAGLPQRTLWQEVFSLRQVDIC